MCVCLCAWGCRAHEHALAAPASARGGGGGGGECVRTSRKLIADDLDLLGLRRRLDSWLLVDKAAGEHLCRVQQRPAREA